MGRQQWAALQASKDCSGSLKWENESRTIFFKIKNSGPHGSKRESITEDFNESTLEVLMGPQSWFSIDHMRSKILKIDCIFTFSSCDKTAALFG